MRLALVGVGGAGGRIVDRIRSHEKATGRTLSGGNALLFDTATSEPDPEALPADQRISIGDTSPDVGEDGVGGDADLAATVTEEERHDIRRVFDVLELHRLDGVLLAAGLGGGTGAGAGSVLIEELQSMYEKPVYGLGVLPGADEGDRPARNAARGLRSMVPAADNVLLFDNDARGIDETAYGRANEALATRIVSLFAAAERPAETAIDTSDIVRTLATGGVSSVGHASIEIEAGHGGVLPWLLSLVGNGQEPDAVAPATVKRLVREAVHSELTLSCDVASAERALIVLSGPATKLSRRGFEGARYWLEEEADTVEVLAGDAPRERADRLAATVLLSNVTDVPRIDALQEQAVAAGRPD